MTTTETNPRLGAALLYAQLGWPVVPLHTPIEGVCDCPKRADCQSPGKHPRTMRGLDDATLDESSVRRWWTMWPNANIAIDLARSQLVDIAPDSLEWFAEFTARGLPPTLQFASGGGPGHAHHLYARPEGCAVYRLTRTGEYDILSAGYAVMPPSLHASGRLYTWLGSVPIATPQASAPGWSVQMVSQRRQTTAEPGKAYDEDAPPVELRGDALDRWYGRLIDCKPNGTVDRSHSLWRLATVLLDAGCTPPFVEQLLADRDVALGWTKFQGRRDAATRYRVIVARAVAGRGPRVRPPKAKQKQKAQPLELLVTARQIADLEPEELQWFAWGMLAGGLITLLDGPPKRAGKTTLLLGMTRAILRGEEWLGQPTNYSPIIYMTEQSNPSFRRNLGRAGLLDRDDLYVLEASRVVQYRWAEVIDLMRNAARDIGARILIVDTLSQFSGIRGDDENKSGAAMEVLKPLQTATGEGLAVILSRHDRKSGGEVGESGRGSSVIAGGADTILHLQRLTGDQTGKERQRLLTGVGRLEETPEKLLIELVPGEEGEPSTYRAIGNQDEVRRQTLGMEILATLPTDPALAMDRKDLRELLACAANDLVRELWNLMKAHYVVRVGGGKTGDPFRYYQRLVEGEDDG